MKLPWLNDPVLPDLGSVRPDHTLMPYEPDPRYDTPDDTLTAVGLTRLPVGISRQLGAQLSDELVDLQSKTLARPGVLAHLLEPASSRIGKLEDARLHARGSALLGSPLLGLAVISQLSELEDASNQGDHARYQRARDSLMLTAGASLGLDTLLAGDEVLANLRSVPSRLMAGQRLTDAASSVAKSAYRRPLGGIIGVGAIAALTHLFGPK